MGIITIRQTRRRRSRRLAGFAVFALLIGIFTFPVAVGAVAGTVDQQQTTIDPGGGINPGVNAVTAGGYYDTGKQIAQTFVPAVTGYLGGVDVNIGGFSYTCGAVEGRPSSCDSNTGTNLKTVIVVSIVSTNASGLPTQGALASAFYTVGAQPVNPDGSTTVPFPFPAGSRLVGLEKGKTYAILIGASVSGPFAGRITNTQFAVSGSRGSTPGDAYTKGESYAMRTLPNAPQDLGFDIFFRTYMMPHDITPPVVKHTITGTLGNGGWYTSDVTITWTVSDPESPITNQTGCDPITLTTDTNQYGAVYVCGVTSAGGRGSDIVTIFRDATPPMVTYTGNAGTYTVDQTVAITCAANEPAPGSGIAYSTCQDISGPAASFKVGTNTFSATATDVAGNTGSGSTTFTVTVTASSLAAVTTGFIEGSAKFKALPSAQQAQIRQLGAVLVQQLTTLPQLPPAQKAQAIQAYTAGVTALARQGWLTPPQAKTLIAAAKAL